MSGLSRKRRRASDDPTRLYSARRHELIKTAAEIFRSRGLSEASFNEIAEKSGVDRASLYYYFGSKTQLFQAVILDSVESVVAEAHSISAAGTSARTRLTELIYHTVNSFSRHYPALHVFVQEDMRRIKDCATDSEQQRLAELADVYVATVESLIQEGVASGEFRDVGAPREVAFVVQGAINWMHRWFLPGDPDGPMPRETAAMFVAILLDGLSAREPLAPSDEDGS